MVSHRLLPLWPLLRVLGRVRRAGLWTDLKLRLTLRLFPTLYSRNRSAETIRDSGNGKTIPQPPVLFQMATGYWLSQAIYVAAKLGLADLLKDGPKSCSTLARATGSDQQSLFRLMRALASAGVFAHLQGDYFALASAGEGLQSNVPGSLRAIVTTLGEIHYQAWGDLLHSIETGSPAFNNVFGTVLFEYLHRNAEAADAFNGGMTDVSSMLAYAVLMAYDFSRIPSIVDIGGGQGKLLRSIVQINPEIKGTVFDLEPAIEIAKQHLGSDACSDERQWETLARGDGCARIRHELFQQPSRSQHASDDRRAGTNQIRILHPVQGCGLQAHQDRSDHGAAERDRSYSSVSLRQQKATPFLLLVYVVQEPRF